MKLSVLLILLVAKLGLTQNPETKSLARSVVSEVITYAGKVSQLTPGPMLIDVNSFQQALSSVADSSVSESAVLRLGATKRSRNATNAVLHCTRTEPCSVDDKGFFVHLDTFELVGDSAYAVATVTWPSARVGPNPALEFVQFKLVFARDVTGWKKVRRLILMST